MSQTHTPHPSMALFIRDIDPQGEVALGLLREAALDVQPLYAIGPAPGFSLPTNLPLGPRDLYVAAYLEEVPVACGAIREVDTSTAEVQRIYVHRDHRRRHLGQAIVQHLEHEARRLGYTRLLLETGDRQAPAMALYQSLGFKRIAAFGRHVTDPTSVCYERRL